MCLKAISPLDGRYYSKINEDLSPFFSEYALIRTRIEVEIEYLLSLLLYIKKNNLKPEPWREIYQNFSEKDAEYIKSIENKTKHDVKAIEYFLQTKIEPNYHQWIHFGLTSQDINQTAMPLMMSRFHQIKLIPKLLTIVEKVWYLGKKYMNQVMLSRTHGQLASPTTLGKELMVFSERLRKQFHLMEDFKFSAKFGGAVGNFNAHYAAFPNKQWNKFADDFIANFGLNRTQLTTQIEPYDNLAEYFHILIRFNTILIDFVRDIWHYISIDYFKLKIVEGEVGSSTMPHKVNPIDFENAEGNLGVANALFNHFALKLPISRLQRDLTDSTVSRNIGVALGHSYLSYISILTGLKKIEANSEAINNDLEKNWIVVAEGIQTILRREGIANAYEKIKGLTRKNKNITKGDIYNWIEEQDLDPFLKEELFSLTPYNYKGQIY